MDILKINSAKKKFYPFGFICKWFSLKLYFLMKKCEQNSKRGEEIENGVKRIQEDVAFAKEAKNELFYVRENISEKERQLNGCYKYVSYIGFHFRKGNYGEVDKALKELGL